MAVGGKRQMTFLLAGPEKRLLVAMAERIPAAVNSDHLTMIGVVGSIGTGVAYYLTNTDPRWLWIASVMLIVNWFGDSLDGTVARVRKVERPRFGFYLDHMIDALATIVIGTSIGLSPYVSFDIALLLVVVYLALSINVYLEAHVFEEFRLAYGILGPTEARLILVIANTVLVLGLGANMWPVEQVRIVGDWVLGGATAIMFLLLLPRIASNLSGLYRAEPLPPRESR